MEHGIILRGIGGFYRVLLNDGRTVQCRPRGRLRREVGTLLAGDRVEVRLQPDDSGVIEAVAPRRTQLRRPPVANVDQVVAVMALAEPEPNLLLLDRLLAVAAAAGMDPLVCWTKADLRPLAVAERYRRLYQQAGYPVVVASTVTGQGLDQLRTLLRGRISTLAGPSGAGKSSLLNALHPSFQLETGAVSRKLGRGRHTTRVVELLPLPGGGLVADTPGFSQLDVRGIPKEELGRLFPEIARILGRCRFPGCLHRAEPDCAVRAAVETEEMDPGRYRHYLLLLDEIEDWEARRYS
ncbi:MAG TPA: ribosome small subunit-dependent GTPase A [Limnochordales bacterium]|nr:ribosome small subunit-dependent GTPase A [Limnochordales bacterium]